MKRIYYILLSVLLSTSLLSCNYLDVLPDEMPHFRDAFATPEAARNFLYSTYAFIPNPRSNQSVDWWTGDELLMSFEHELWASFVRGTFTAGNPVISYWNSLFIGIRQAWIFYNNVHTTPGLSQAVINDMRAQAQFLIAYYHWLLLRKYGPIIIVDHEFDLAMHPSDFPARTPYHEAVEWIAERFLHAAAGLPTSRPPAELGLATSIAAKAIRARMLLYAASPLFNSPENARLFGDFRNPDGTLLIPAEFDPLRWVRAREANRLAIDAAHAAGHRLFQAEDANPNFPHPAVPAQRALRFTVLERTSRENLWVDARHADHHTFGKSFPRHQNNAWNGMGITLRMLDRFLTENGLPIQYDPAFDYEGRFGAATFPADHPNGEGVTLRMNLGREPRFYAWVAFHGSYFEIQGLYRPGDAADMRRGWADDRLRLDGWAILTTFLRDDPQGAGNRTNNFSPAGTLNKKTIHPGAILGASLTEQHYPWPVIRLAELYLNYAEAAVEMGDLNQAMAYINRVRERAGIPTVQTAWSSIGVSITQDRLREIVRRERQLELYKEHHNFWDLRRWLWATRYMDGLPEGLNVRGTNIAEFGMRIPQDGRPVPGGTAFAVTRNFMPAHYLMPIPASDVRISPSLVQNPGY